MYLKIYRVLQLLIRLLPLKRCFQELQIKINFKRRSYNSTLSEVKKLWSKSGLKLMIPKDIKRFVIFCKFWIFSEHTVTKISAQTLIFFISTYLPPDDVNLYYFKLWQFDPSQASLVHFNFRAGSTFPVPVCTVRCTD